MSPVFDTIVIKAPAGTKARWVRQSQREGKKLSDWIIQKIDGAPMKKAAITIPPGLQFADLKLARDATGTVSFDQSPIERICAASGIDVAVLRDEPEDDLAALTAWYWHHLALAERLIRSMPT